MENVLLYQVLNQYSYFNYWHICVNHNNSFLSWRRVRDWAINSSKEATYIFYSPPVDDYRNTHHLII